ncbi:hypothetical protein ACODT5_06125 [Streptomyces sp. 5.8]|uniref:hypothetical protein n=1 Tax=Streptomyces sp. 5.8 TaxID=3406571 RepID=UPI003BB522AE
MGKHGQDAAREDAAGRDAAGSDPAREGQARPHHPQGGRPELLPDEGAMVDEHGRPPGVPSRTGTGSSSPPSDPERVERAAAG